MFDLSSSDHSECTYKVVFVYVDYNTQIVDVQ
jgi:hypothetical protein